mgnify:CR=1 FL=1
MYCTIEDAWGQDFNQDAKDVDSDKPKEFIDQEYKLKETFDSETNSEPKQRKNLHKQYLKLKEMFDDSEKESKVCLAVNTHINTCSICRNRYLKRMNEHSSMPTMPSFSIPSISQLMHRNSDAVTIFLICIMILLIIKLFNKNN